MPVPCISLVEALPDHLVVEILSRLVEQVGLRGSVAHTRATCRLFRTCTNTALEQSLTTISSRTLDATRLRDFVRCVLYSAQKQSNPHFVALRSVVLSGCEGVDAHALGWLLAHAPAVETVQVEGTAVRPEDTHCLANLTRTPVKNFRLGTWTALHEAVSSPRRFADAQATGALEPGGALSGIYVDVCNERGYDSAWDSCAMLLTPCTVASRLTCLTLPLPTTSASLYGRRLTPLLVAAYNGVTDAAKWLLEQGACPDACDCYHVSALMKAAYFGHASTVGTLLQYGASASRVDMYGAGALAKAAYRGHTAVVRVLLASGARTDGEDLYGNRPLHSAVASGHRNIAMMLLQYGTKGVDAQPSGRNEAFHAVRLQRRSTDNGGVAGNSLVQVQHMAVPTSSRTGARLPDFVSATDGSHPAEAEASSADLRVAVTPRVPGIMT